MSDLIGLIILVAFIGAGAVLLACAVALCKGVVEFLDKT